MHKVFCERLKALREEREISQAKLAKMLDVTQQAIFGWEKGLTQPDMAIIVKLAIFFSVSADYLLGLSDKISND